MKKNGLFLALFLLAAVFLLAGCGTKKLHGYDNADEYGHGAVSVSEPVSHILIHWIHGTVHMTEGDGETFEVYEESREPLDSVTEVHTYTKNEVLHIEFAESEATVDSDLEKDLFIVVPKGSELVDVAAVGTDYSVDFCGISTKSLMVTISTGNIHVEGFGDLSTATLLTKKGNIDIEARSISEAVFTAESGSVTVKSDITEATLSVRKGDSKIQLPKDCGFQVIFISSGTFMSDDEYTGSDGIYESQSIALKKAQITFNSEKGNLIIERGK